MNSMHDTEVWFVVKVFPAYEVSNWGRVRRCQPGRGRRPGGADGCLVPFFNEKGYLKVDLNDGGRREGHVVQVLVAEAFIGPRPYGYEVDHVDKDKTNNRADNLEYVLPKQNKWRSWETWARGSRVGGSILTEETATMARRLLAAGHKRRAVAARVGVSYRCIVDLLHRRTWQHVE